MMRLTARIRMPINSADESDLDQILRMTMMILIIRTADKNMHHYEEIESRF